MSEDENKKSCGVMLTTRSTNGVVIRLPCVEGHRHPGPHAYFREESKMSDEESEREATRTMKRDDLIQASKDVVDAKEALDDAATRYVHIANAVGEEFVELAKEIARPSTGLLQAGAQVMQGLASWMSWMTGRGVETLALLRQAKKTLKACHDEEGEPTYEDVGSILSATGGRRARAAEGTS